jgi:sugar lactone lactonase YvrE
MHFKQVALTTAISVVVGLTGVDAMAADTTAALPLSHYSHMVVDAAHQHIFFSEGKGSAGILVTDLSGDTVTTIADEAGATGLALSADGSTVYAALADGDAIAAIDSSSLTESARYPTGAGTAPVSVTVAGGKLWYGYTDGDAGGIGAVDLSAAAPAAAPQPGLSHWAVAPLLASAHGILAAEEPAGNLSHVATFDLSSGTASAEADTHVAGGGTATGLQVSPDGSRVWIAAPQDAAVRAFRTSDLLSPDPSAPYIYWSGGSGSGPNSLAIAPDGTTALGSGTSSGADAFVYYGANLAMNSEDFAPDSLVPDGLAFGSDGLGLYAVTRDSSGAYTLHDVTDLRVADTQPTLTHPQYAVPTQQFQVTGSLTTRGSIPAGASLQVSRDGTALPDTTVAADGSFAFTDTRPDVGAYAYQVSFAGDATHHASTGSLTVHVAKLSTGVWAGDVSSARPGSVVFSGTLSNSYRFGSIPEGTTVQVTRTNEDTHETVTLPSVTVTPTANGSADLTVTDAPGITGWFTYELSYAGDATHEASPRSDTSMMVSPYPTALTLSAPATAARGGTVKITGALTEGPYPSGPQVTVARTDLAHPSTPVQWTVPLGTDGSIAFQDTPQIGGANTYTVTYPGDATRSTSTASATVKVSRAATKLSVTTDAASYAYGATAKVTAHLGTTYNGRYVSVYAQPNGDAKTLLMTAKVNSHGDLPFTYKLSHNTTFTAGFAGDYRYAPATATRAVTDHVKVTESLSGYYTSTHYGSTLYRVYHHTAKPTINVTVTPNKSDQCLHYQAQRYYSGAWHTLTTSGCYHLTPKSTGSGQLTLTNAVGQKFRMRAEYVHSSWDTTNISTWGGWQYFTVRK